MIWLLHVIHGKSKLLSVIFSADVLRENTEAVFAACDAAHGRWAKLLGVRALLHPKLRLQEFLHIYDITQNFIAATEKVRLNFSFFFVIIKLIHRLSKKLKLPLFSSLVEDWVIVFAVLFSRSQRHLLTISMIVE